jgi:hypothetical protein
MQNIVESKNQDLSLCCDLSLSGSETIKNVHIWIHQKGSIISIPLLKQNTSVTTCEQRLIDPKDYFPMDVTDKNFF